MLDLDQLDLGDLCVALEDNSPEHSWWLDPSSGELEFWPESAEALQDDHPEDRGLVAVGPIASHEAYADMEDFAQRASEPRARDLLLRAISGRGAFRRFKDTLLEFPQLREAWFRFHDIRMQQRALAWSAERELVPREDAARAIARLESESAAILAAHVWEGDTMAVARSVANELRTLYGRRLKRVVLFGSCARGDAGPESDIDLLVVLDRISSRRTELDRMSEIMWRHSLEHTRVLTELPVSDAEYRESSEPLLSRIREEGLPVA